jgi:hypothetical protein
MEHGDETQNTKHKTQNTKHPRGYPARTGHRLQTIRHFAARTAPHRTAPHRTAPSRPRLCAPVNDRLELNPDATSIPTLRAHHDRPMLHSHMVAPAQPRSSRQWPSLEIHKLCPPGQLSIGLWTVRIPSPSATEGPRSHRAVGKPTSWRSAFSEAGCSQVSLASQPQDHVAIRAGSFDRLSAKLSWWARVVSRPRAGQMSPATYRPRPLRGTAVCSPPTSDRRFRVAVRMATSFRFLQMAEISLSLIVRWEAQDRRQ